MHLPCRAVRIQFAISVPLVERERDVARQVATFPTAKGPRDAVQVSNTGTRRRPLVV